MRLFISIFIFILCSNSIKAQGAHLGLRIGINSVSLNGPAEENANYKPQSGFHIGPTFSYAFSDIMGLRGEFIFSQKGSSFEYSGPSYLKVKKNTEYLNTSGTRNMLLAVNNNYIDIPLMFYTLLFEHVDLSVGGYASFLVGSSVKGDLNYTGKRDNSNANVGPIKYLIDGNYLRDKAGQVSSNLTQIIKIEGDQVTLPQRIGAYYEYRDKPDGKKYNFLDYGLTGAIHYRFSRGLYFGVRYQMGLSDVSNDKFDISYKTLSPSKEFIVNPAKFTNSCFQFSIMLQL
ncbi:MAG: porin family protein [Saprospiraceae bacterium]